MEFHSKWSTPGTVPLNHENLWTEIIFWLVVVIIIIR